MKKPFLIFVSIVLAVLTYGGSVSLWAESSVAAASSTVKMYVNPANVGATAGYTTSLQLRLYKNSPAKVDYAEAHLSFSTANLEVVSISKQGSYFNNGGGPSIAYNNTNGLITVMGSGPELGQVDDVLMATVVFKAKAPGAGAMSYTSDSQAGDITNGGHVKNVLDTRVGAVVNVTNPVTTSQGGGTTAPSAPTAPTPPAASTPSPGAPVTENPVPSSPAVTASPRSDAASAIDRTVTRPPTWLQLLLPAASGIGLLGIGGMGYVLYRKRHSSGVSLPAEETPDAEVMPSTEGIVGIGAMSSLDAMDDLEVSNDVPQPITEDDNVLTPTAVDVASQEVTSVAPASHLETTVPNEVLVSVAESSPVVAPSAALQSLASTETPPLAVSDTAKSETASPLRSNTDEARTPVSPPPIVEAPVVDVSTPSALMPPIPPVGSQELVTPPPASAPIAAESQEIDYKNLPDMYEIGEQRLQNEGFGPASQPANKPQTV